MDADITGVVADSGAAPEAVVAAGDAPINEGRMDDFAILDAPDEPEKPADEKPAEEPAKVGDEAKTDEKKAADEAAAKKPQLVEEPARVKQLREAIEKNAALKGELDKPENAALRNMLFANARRSEQLGQYQQHFRTVDQAKMAREAAEDLTEIEGYLYSGTPEGYGGLLNHLFQASLDRDPKTGEPLKNSDGSLKTLGHYEGLLQHYRREHFWPSLGALCGDEGGKAHLAKLGLEPEDVLGAVDVLRKVLGDPEGGTPANPQGKPAVTAAKPSGWENNLSQQEQEELAKFRAAQRQGGNSESDAGKFDQQVKAGVNTPVLGHIKGRVDALASGLSEASRKRICDETFAEVAKTLRADKLYAKQFTDAKRVAAATGDIKPLADLALSHARELIGPVMKAKIKEFSGDALTQNKQTIDKLTDQAKRTEPKSSGGAASPTRPEDDATMLREAAKLSRDLNNRGLKDHELLDLEETLAALRKRAAAKA